MKHYRFYSNTFNVLSVSLLVHLNSQSDRFLLRHGTAEFKRRQILKLDGLLISSNVSRNTFHGPIFGTKFSNKPPS